MTKKDYELIAECFSFVRTFHNGETKRFRFALDSVTNELADKLARQNPRFDYSKFSEACRKEFKM